MTMNPAQVEAIQSWMRDRYSRRMIEFGPTIKTLGWGDRRQQEERFRMVTRRMDLSHRVVLDLGCGFGDLLAYLHGQEIPVLRYVGSDLNEDLLVEARRRFPEVEFLCRNILLNPFEGIVCDVGIMLGVINVRLPDADHYEYAQALIRRAYEACGEALAVDMLSCVRAPEYPQEDFVFYYEPDRILKMALGITPHVGLFHDYLPNPQREMLLILRRAPWK